jgi:hypothetical protein
MLTFEMGVLLCLGKKLGGPTRGSTSAHMTNLDDEYGYGIVQTHNKSLYLLSLEPADISAWSEAKNVPDDSYVCKTKSSQQ